jgi:serine/threonine protein phosphatase PrpC
MNIVLNKSFSVSETETGMKNPDVIYPNNQQMPAQANRLYITCGGNSNKSLIAGQILCDAIQTYFHSFGENISDIYPDFIEKSIRFGEISLSEFQKENPGTTGISSILCLLYFSADCIYFAQIGKSHIYQIRDNRIIYRSIDSSPDRKVQGVDRPADVNIVKLKDIQAHDQFFVYSGELGEYREEQVICQILSDNRSAEEKLSQIKKLYLCRSNGLFSAHLIPIHKVKTTRKFKHKLNLFSY